MVKREKHPHYHYGKFQKWGKWFNRAFIIFILILIIGYVLYKLKLVPEGWNQIIEIIEITSFVIVVSTKGNHFYHDQMHCTKCKKNFENVGSFWKFLMREFHEWCDKL